MILRRKVHAVITVATLFVFCTAQVTQAGLVAYWDFEDGAGSETLTDRTGNDFDGELIGDHSGGLLSDNGWTSGAPGSSTPATGLDFDLTPGTHVTIPNGIASEMGIDGNEPKSVSFWANWRSFEKNTGPFTLGRGGGGLEGGEFALKKNGNADNQQIRAQHWGGNTHDYDIFPLDQGFDLQDTWTLFVILHDGNDGQTYFNGELVGERLDYELALNDNQEFRIGQWRDVGFDGIIDDMAVWDHALTQEEIGRLLAGESPLSVGGIGGEPQLQAGDADQDLDFDQLDLVKVQISAKYLTGQAATWGDGDWDGAPGGKQGSPPAGNGFFGQLDIVSALASGRYLTGPYAALAGPGFEGDEQTSLKYDANTGELSVDSPAGKDLTSINITSAGNKFIGDKPAVLDGAFDNFAAENIFKATFGASFGDTSFGTVLPIGLIEADVTADLSAVGSLAGGGDLGDVDLIYVPEPASILLVGLGMLGIVIANVRRRGRPT